MGPQKSGGRLQLLVTGTTVIYFHIQKEIDFNIDFLECRQCIADSVTDVHGGCDHLPSGILIEANKYVAHLKVSKRIKSFIDKINFYEAATNMSAAACLFSNIFVSGRFSSSYPLVPKVVQMDTQGSTGDSVRSTLA